MTSHSGLVVAMPGLVRDGLQAVLSAVPGVRAVEPADCAAAALERLQAVLPLDPTHAEAQTIQSRLLRARLRHLARMTTTEKLCATPWVRQRLDERIR